MSAFEDNVLLNYMNQENVQLEDLWRIHPSSNLDIYESVFSGMYVFVWGNYLPFLIVKNINLELSTMEIPKDFAF